MKKKYWEVLNLNDKEAVLIATDLIRTVSEHQTGIKRFIGKVLNKIIYAYYKTI